MNFQEKFADATAELRARADSFAQATFANACTRAGAAAGKVRYIRKSLAVLSDAGRQLNQVARHHAHRFVKQNSPLVAAVRKDVSDLARTTFATLTNARKPRKAVRKAATSRKRARKAA